MNHSDKQSGEGQMPPLPAEFAARVESTPGLEGLAAALDTPPAVSVRLNRRLTDAAPADAVPWACDGFYLPRRPQFTFDPALHQGVYYVQDASSMATACAVAQAAAALKGHLRLLDACAAPGGKTIGAAEALPGGSLVVANEFSRQRCAVLAENLAKRGIAAIITCDDASRLRGLDGFFDIIAADVPCSGEGMMRKEAEARRQWSPGLVRECAALQAAITDSLWQALRPGGFFVYSTCTFNREENEDIIARLIEIYGAEALAIDALEGVEGIAGALYGATFPAYHFLPGRVRGEGLFLALLRKPGDAPHAAVKAPKPAKEPATAASGWLADGWMPTLRGDSMYALPAELAAEAAAIDRRMHVVAPGVEVGSVKGRDIIPAQPLALSPALRRGAFPQVEVGAADALAFLGRNAIALPEGTPRGFVLLTHGGNQLGFVKNLGSRANNLYPAQWRILAQAPSPVSIL